MNYHRHCRRTGVDPNILTDQPAKKIVGPDGDLIEAETHDFKKNKFN